ncbi:hypothetical protein K1Y78_50990, partial [Streptomyces sp. tea 10]|nr:hypothetical protein [Streptomyces sp. tea 10]
LMHWILQRAAPLFSNADVLARRLVRDGSRKDVMDYRAEQVLFGVAGAVVGSMIGTALVLRADVNIAILAVGAVLGAGTGVWLRNYLLSRSIQRREKRMLAEFPAVAELMALAVGAGESTVGARYARDISVSRTSVGSLPAVEIRVVSPLPVVAALGPPRALEVSGHAVDMDS